MLSDVFPNCGRVPPQYTTIFATFFFDLDIFQHTKTSLHPSTWHEHRHKFLDSGTVELPLGGDATTLNGMTARL